MYFVDVYDKDGNKLKTKLMDVSRYDPSLGHNICLMLEENVSILSDEDLYYLKYLLGQKLKYGGDTVTEMRKYSELYSKIEKLLEKNKVNQ